MAGTALLVGGVDRRRAGEHRHRRQSAGGPGLGLVLLAAVFLGNVPESLGSAAAMREEGRSRGYIIGVWTIVGVLCTVATVSANATSRSPRQSCSSTLMPGPADRQSVAQDDCRCC